MRSGQARLSNLKSSPLGSTGTSCLLHPRQRPKCLEVPNSRAHTHQKPGASPPLCKTSINPGIAGLKALTPRTSGFSDVGQDQGSGPGGLFLGDLGRVSGDIWGCHHWEGAPAHRDRGQWCTGSGHICTPAFREKETARSAHTVT